MEGLMTNFWSIVADFKRKPYELLDFALNQFDRDYLEFNANIHELESSLQGFINQSFETINSTEQALDPSSTLRSLHRPLPPLTHLTPPNQALDLLKQLHIILHRDSLKDDLDSKFMVIFHKEQSLFFYCVHCSHF